MFPEAYFSYTGHPDFPLTKFAQGDLGILQPTYARSFLVAAYRYLVDKPLNASEQRAFLDLWKDRLISKGDFYGYGSDAVKSWLKARAQVTSATVPEIVTFRKVSDLPDSYGQFENCPSSAFQNAIQALNSRITKYGASSTYVKDWVNGQDDVFCHCGSRAYDYKTKIVAPEGPFPSELPTGTNPDLKSDRDYQLAAAHFYAKRYDEAEQEFLSIAKDDNSPWKNVGLYMAARCMIRKGTLPDEVDKESLAKASDLLNQILKDEKLSTLQASARGLLSFIRCQGNAKGQLVDFSTNMFDPAQASSLRQSIYDYTFLLDKYFSSQDAYCEQATPEANKILTLLKENDLSDWVLAFQTAKGDQAKARSLERWRETHSLPWLIAALSKIDPGSSDGPELMREARAVAPTSPGYPTVRYWMINLLMKGNHNEEAAKALNEVLQVKLPPSALNQFLNFKIVLVAPSLKEFIQLSVRRPIASFVDYSDEFPDPDEGIKLLDATNFAYAANPCFVPLAADILNQDVPLNLLKDAAFISTAGTNPRFDLAQAAWVRAVLLKRDDVALALVPLLKKLKPALVPLLDAYAQAKSAAERQFAASFLILKNPGSRPCVTPGQPRDIDYGRIETYGDNWWRSWGTPEAPGGGKPNLCSVTYPRFLTTADVAAAKAEVKAGQALGDGLDFLVANVLTYAEKHPQDARLPEALHLSVKASKLGALSGPYSKRAFRLLHQRYGNTPWAKKTPYYYGA